MDPTDSIHFHYLNKECISGIVAFILIIIFDVSGVILAVTTAVGADEKGAKWAHFCAAIGTIISSMLGCSPIIVHLESLAGISEGGRTGLTACVISFLFFLSMFFGPIMGDVPAQASAPVLVCIGTLMMRETKQIDWDTMQNAIPAFLTISMMPLTYSIANGLYFGLVSYSVLYF